MAKPEIIIPKGIETLHDRFHSSPIIKAGNVLYLSGAVPVDDALRVANGIEAQMVRLFENQERMLAAAGATWDDVVQRESYHIDTREGWFPTRFGGNVPVDFLSVNDRYFTNPNYPA